MRWIVGLTVVFIGCNKVISLIILLYALNINWIFWLKLEIGGISDLGIRLHDIIRGMIDSILL